MVWLKSIGYLLLLSFIYAVAPTSPLDPWGLFSLKKITALILALSIIQFFGALLVRLLGLKLGVVFAGILGGFVSSTATTATLARNSKNQINKKNDTELITYLSATLAMLIEAIALLAIGSTDYHFEIYFLFLSPVATTLILLFYSLKKISLPQYTQDKQSLNFAISPILKLALFILIILALSKALQKFFGNAGLLLLTFITSLFEMHGSLIANIQLHENSSIDTTTLVNLISCTIIASYISKMFLVYSLGSDYLKKTLLNWTLIILANYSVCWLTIYLWLSRN